MAAWSFVALLAVVLFGIAVDRGVRHSNDFDNFHEAATRVWSEGELFKDKSVARYPPSFQVLMSPLGSMPMAAAAAVWALINLGSYAFLAWLLLRYVGIPLRQQAVAWFGVLPVVVSNITLGQSGPVLVALATGGVVAAAHGRAVGGGAALALGGLIKVFPGPLLVVPVVLRRAGGALAGAVLAVAAVALWLALAVGPMETLQDGLRWVEEVRTEQRPAELIEAVRGLRYNNQGLAITLVRSLTTDFSHAPQRAAKGSIQVASLPLPVAWGLYYALVAALVATWCAVAWRVRRAAPTPRLFLGLEALTVPVLLSVSPIVWTHYFLWWLPGLAFLSHHTRPLLVLGAVSLAGMFSDGARALGLHIGITLVLFVAVARELWRAAPEAPSQTRATA